MTLEQALNDHDALIWKCCHSAALTWNTDPVECYSLARYHIITKIHPKFDPARGKFTTHLVACLRNLFIDYFGKMKNSQLLFLEELPEVLTETDRPSLFEVLGNDLEDWDSMEIMYEIRDLIREEVATEEVGVYQNRRIIRERLSAAGWASNVISAAFNDIREALR